MLSSNCNLSTDCIIIHTARDLTQWGLRSRLGQLRRTGGADASPPRQRLSTMTDFGVTRAGAILGIADLAASLHFYRDQLGLEMLASYDDPPYATLTAAGARISLAEQNYPAEDRPGVVMSAPADRSRASVVLVLEVDDAQAAHSELSGRGVPFLAAMHHPPSAGLRSFSVDAARY